ncbi:MAG: SUMF1/EgtB/PvdO family nonheme iron enzyme, partial [Bacteroidota bacterium]
MRYITMIICGLICYLTPSNLVGLNKFQSTKRAFVEINASTTNSAEGCIHYFDYWSDTTNHSAFYLFFKDEKGHSIYISELSLDSDRFTSSLAEDEKSVYIIPKRHQTDEFCIDFQITFRRDHNKVTPYYHEMVYIPKGEFSLGGARSFQDRNNINTSRGSLGAPLNAFFKTGQNTTFAGAFLVDSEAEIAIGNCEGCLSYLDAEITGVNTFSGDKKGKLSSAFPKGYNAFYQMRYELTEREYCAFLNSLPKEQSNKRIAPDAIFEGGARSAYGNFITIENGVYRTSNPDQACSFLSWNDCLAYADWAGIRIMTELEFEKTCRGFAAPKFREYAWGSNEMENGFLLDKRLFRCKGDNLCVDGNVHVNLLGFSNFKDVCGTRGSDPTYIGCRELSAEMQYRGPLQTGIHSKGRDNLNRQNSGGGYFGTLDLSGNLREPVIPVGSAGSRKYTGSVGDGSLGKNGEADNQDWYYAEAKDLVFGYRGGCWAFHENHARIADRFNVYRKGI